MATKGTWFGGQGLFEDRGWTEKIANFFGSQGSPQATLFYNPAAAQVGQMGPAVYAPRNDSTGGNTLGAQTTGTNPTNNPNPNPTSNPNPNPGNNGPSQEELINQVFQPQMNYLNQAESTLRSSYPSAQQEIEGQYNTSKTSLDTQKASGERDLATQQTQAGQRKEDASSAARRLYDELMRGGVQRFGGASSAGQAYTELNAAEQQRRQGDINTQYQSAMQQIDGYKASLNEKYTTALSELENQKTSALNSARDEFNNRLLEITRMKSEAESNKAAARLDALNQLRNQVYAINMQSLQFAQQLAAQKDASLSQVETYRQNALNYITGGNQAVMGLQANTTLNPTSGLALGPTMSQGVNATPTGQVSYRRPEDMYTGQISYRRPDEYLTA